jgi:hypothetical protein
MKRPGEAAAMDATKEHQQRREAAGAEAPAEVQTAAQTAARARARAYLDLWERQLVEAALHGRGLPEAGARPPPR